MFSPEEMKGWLLSDFGLDLPLPPVKLVVGRMVKRGIARRHDKIYIINQISCDPEAFDKNQAEMVSHYRAVRLGLQEFARDALGKELTEAECESGLLNYIDEYSIECVSSFRYGDAVPIRGRDPGHWRFIVSRFVNHISSRSPEEFRYFVTVLTGRMLANALLASDLSGLGAKFRHTSIYLDTPLILQILGVVGKENQSYAREIFDLFSSAGADLKALSHTMEETDQVLRNAEKYLETPSGGYGDVIVALREAGMSSSDVALIRARLRNILHDENIRVEDTPAYIEKHQIDELALESEMDTAGLHHRNKLARRADINSVRSIYVLRRGISPRRVEDCRALVLTNNAAFARAAYSYGQKYEEFKQVSPVITDFSLTNIVWLKSPLKHADLPVRLLLTHCYSVLKPSQALWKRFVDELDRLRDQKTITPEQHQYMRYELRVRDELMNLTLGDEQEVSEQLVIQILDRHEQEIARPWKSQLDRVQTEHQEALDKLTASEIKIVGVDAKLRRVAHVVYIGLRVILISAAVLFLLYGQGVFPRSQPSTLPWRIVSGFLGLAVIAITIVHLIFGFKIVDPLDRLCSFIETRFLGWLRRVFGLGNG
jgi:hypothetical protein